jgi:predicted nuclease with TOPRIM domain
LIIAVLLIILGYGVYTGVKVKATINSLEVQVQELTEERDRFSSQLDELLVKYDMLKDDVFELEKSCITENACKGHFPGIRWNCNNVGDEVNNYSHVCVCDNNCVLVITPIQ